MSESNTDQPENQSEHPIVSIAKHLFPSSPDSFYTNLNHSIQIDIYYNALKVARDEWGYKENSEKMNVWLDRWWVEQVFQQKWLQQGNSSQQQDNDTGAEQQREGEDANSQDAAPPKKDRTNPTVSDMTQSWKAFIMPHSLPRKPEPAEESTDKKAKSKKKQEEPEEKENLPPLYSLDDVQLMTEYLSNSLFQFFDLYQHVFTNEKQSSTEETFSHIFQHPVSIPPLNQFKEEGAYKAEQEQLEREKQQQLEEEKRKEEERIEQVRKDREEEERRQKEEQEAPRLSSAQLDEIASYLRFHLKKDLSEKEKSILDRMQGVQDKLKEQEERPPSGKKKKK